MALIVILIKLHSKGTDTDFMVDGYTSAAMTEIWVGLKLKYMNS